jgi:hypothetical protein
MNNKITDPDLFVSTFKSKISNHKESFAPIVINETMSYWYDKYGYKFLCDLTKEELNKLISDVIADWNECYYNIGNTELELHEWLGFTIEELDFWKKNLDMYCLLDILRNHDEHG